MNNLLGYDKFKDLIHDSKLIGKVIIFFATVMTISYFTAGLMNTTQNIVETDKEIIEDWKKSNTIKTQ